MPQKEDWLNQVHDAAVAASAHFCGGVAAPAAAADGTVADDTGAAAHVSAAADAGAGADAAVAVGAAVSAVQR